MSELTTSRGERPGRGFVTPGATGARTALVALLALVLVVAVVVAALSWRTVAEHSAEEDDRADATRVAEQFAVRANNFAPDDVAGYQKSVTSLLTTKFAADYSDVMDEYGAEITRTKMTSTGQVTIAGVQSIDPDSATVLVVADATVRSSYGTRVRHFRWQVALVKVGGTWRVDDFNPVGG